MSKRDLFGEAASSKKAKSSRTTLVEKALRHGEDLCPIERDASTTDPE